MRVMELAKRNFKEIWLDPVLLGVTIALPPVLLIVLQALGAAIGEEAPQLSATMLAPGIALFGFVMLMFSAALTLAKDRETAFLARRLTTPVTAGQFIAAYSIPYLPIAILQAAMMFAIAYFGGLENHGNPGLVILALLIMAVCYVALGMIMGSLLTVNQNSVA